MKSLNITVTEGVNLNKSLEFSARSVQVDNITSSWLWVEGGGRYVPPFQYGVIVPLEGTAQGNVRWQTPVGVPVPTPGTASAQVTFMEGALPASNGQPVTIPSQQIPLPIASVKTNTNVSGGNSAVVGSTTFTLGTSTSDQMVLRFNVPPGANSLILVGNTQTNVTTHASAIYTYDVGGVQTETSYIASTPGGSPLPAAFIIASSADNQVDVLIQNAAAQGVNSLLELVASFGTQAVEVQSAVPLIVGGPAQAQGSNPVPVEPGNFGTTFTQTSAANGNNVLSTPVPLSGQFARLSSFVVSWSVAPAAGSIGQMQVRDSTNTTIWAADSPSGSIGPFIFEFPTQIATVTGNSSLTFIVLAGGAGAISIMSGVYSLY